MIRPADPLNIGAYSFVADNAGSRFHIRLYIVAQEYSMVYKSNQFYLSKGINQAKGLGWDTTDTTGAISTLRALGLFSGSHNCTLSFFQDTTLLQETGFDYHKPVSFINQVSKSGDSLEFSLAESLPVESVQYHLYIGNSIVKNRLYKSKPLAADTFDSILFMYDSVLLHRAVWKPEPGVVLRKPKFERALPDLHKRKVFELMGFSNRVQCVLSDSSLAFSSLQTPYYSLTSNAKANVLGIPFKAAFYGFNQWQDPLDYLITSSRSYYKVSFDTEAFREMSTIDPKDPKLKEAIRLKDSELSIEKMLLEAKLDSIGQGAVLPGLDGIPDSNKVKVPKGVSSPGIDMSFTDTASLSRKERRELERMRARLKDLNEQQKELETFRESLDSLGTQSKHIGIDAMPRAMDQGSLDGLTRWGTLHKLKSFELGAVYPLRFGSMRSNAFVELIGVSTTVSTSNRTSVYAMAGRNRLTPYFPLPPLGVYEIGITDTGKRVRFSAIGSMESGRKVSSAPLLKEEVKAVDSARQVGHRNIYLNIECDLSKQLLLGVDIALPLENVSRTIYPLGQREKLYAMFEIKNVRLSAFVENHPPADYSAIDLSTMQDVITYGGKAGAGFLKDQVSLEFGYEILEQGVQDSVGKQRTRQKGFSYGIHTNFNNWPQVSLSYTPFSFASMYADPVTGQVFVISNRTQLWLGTANYQKVMGNQLLGVTGIYQKVNNTAVYERSGTSPAYEGSMETLRITGFLKGRRHALNLEGSALSGDLLAQRMARMGYEFSYKSAKFGPALGYGLRNNNETYTWSLKAQWNIPTITLSAEAGSFMSADNLPNPYAVFGVLHTFR